MLWRWKWPEGAADRSPLSRVEDNVSWTATDTFTYEQLVYLFSERALVAAGPNTTLNAFVKSTYRLLTCIASGALSGNCVHLITSQGTD
jgi:hypothetical protein